MKRFHAKKMLTQRSLLPYISGMNSFDAENPISRLADIARVAAGFPFRETVAAKAGGNALVVQMKNVDPELGVDWASATRTDLPGKKEPDWLRDGDIVFAARGTKNYAALIANAPSNAVCSPHFFVIRVRDEAKTLPSFIAWQINQPPARKYFEQGATGSYILNIRRQVLEDLTLAIPPREQQEIIISLNHAVQSERRVLEGLIANRKSQMEAIAVGLQRKFGG
jgi:hypothetical protein